jgi:uncharacterized repeat protein (TIGR02543 family)
MGRVLQNPPGTWQKKDTTVTLTARSKSGYRFLGWTGAATARDSILTLRMDTTKTVTARFGPLHGSAPLYRTLAEDGFCRVTKSEMQSWLADSALGFTPLYYWCSDSSTHLHAVFQTGGLQVQADRDWNGTGWLLLSGVDGSDNRRTDTLKCTVTAVNDAPGPFRLLEPTDGWALPEPLHATLFRWTRSPNADAANGDLIHYELHLRNEEGAELISSSTSDTALTVDPSGAPGGSYRWMVEAVDGEAASTWADPPAGHRILVQSGIATADRTPTAFRLRQNYPNPFNATTEFAFDVPVQGDVKVDVYSADGRHIRSLVHGITSAGAHRILWDGKDASGGDTGSGIYVCRMTATHFTQSVKLIYLK